MPAQVTSIPGDTETLKSGSVIVAKPGVRYQIADVDPADGSVGPVLTPDDLVMSVNDPEFGDMTVVLPDGTVLVFAGMIDLFDQGTGFADAGGVLVVASLEDAVAPASGSEGDETPEGEGSSAAFNDPAIGDGNDFGNGPGGDFEDLDPDLFDFGDTDPNLILAVSMEGNPDTDIPLRVIDPIDPVDPVDPVTPPVPKAGCPICRRPRIVWGDDDDDDDLDQTIPGTAGTDTLTGGGGADTFVMNLSDLQDSLALADIITDFQDGVDRILLNLNGGGPVTLTFTEQYVPGVGKDIKDTVIAVEGTGEIVAILQDVNSTYHGTFDDSDVTIVA